jgi:hypothetical protein
MNVTFALWDGLDMAAELPLDGREVLPEERHGNIIHRAGGVIEVVKDLSGCME